MSVREMTVSPPTHTTSRGALLASALGYAQRGFAVHPLLVGGKEPRWRDWESRATLDPELISRTWGRAPFNIGVACGPSKIVVLDLDVPKCGETPSPELAESGVTDGESMLWHLAEQADAERPAPTMTIRTRSGGLHLVYRAPIGVEVRKSAGTVAWCIDVRAAGGYVVGIGSLVEGGTYALEGGITTPVDLPEWMLTLITTPVEPPKRGEPGHGAEAVARLRDLSRAAGTTREERWAAGILASELADLAAMAAGTGRNQRLNLAAYRTGQLVGAGLLQHGVAETALIDTARSCGVGTSALRPYAREIEKTVESGMQAGIARPRYMNSATQARRVGGAA